MAAWEDARRFWQFFSPGPLILKYCWTSASQLNNFRCYLEPYKLLKVWWSLASPWRIAILSIHICFLWAGKRWDQLLCPQGLVSVSQKASSPIWPSGWFYRTHKNSGLTWAGYSCDTSRHHCSRGRDSFWVPNLKYETLHWQSRCHLRYLNSMG